MGLPSGYRRLEYIQSSGKQWIDTGFKPNQDTRVVMNCYVISFNSCDMFLFGARVSAGNTAFYVAADDANTKWFISYGSEVQNPVGTCTGHHSIDMNKNSVSIDDAITTLSASTFQSASNLLLFATNTAGSADSQRGTMNLYSCQIYDNGTLIRDYIPCQTTSGEIGLWDDVNGVLYGNAGTGTFAAGPVIAIAIDKSEIMELEYIQSSGTQYINTGFRPNQDTRVVMDVDLLAGTAWVALFGAREAATTKEYSVVTSSATAINSRFNTSDVSLTVSTVIGRYLIDKNKALCLINSSKLENTSSTFQPSYSMYLFAQNNGGVTWGLAKVKLYYCKIYDNGMLVRDYIPAKLSDGTVGLYDKLNGLLYINAGTGILVGGGYISLKTGDILNYDYTGVVQPVTLPKGVYKLEVWGAQGGYRSSSSYGGRGGYSVGTITITQPTHIFIYVGGSGNTGGTSGGFNGGGKRSDYYGGGGASDIRINQDSLYARVIVAGGGGSDGSSIKTGMYGGGTTGGSTTANYGTGGYGGTQTGVSSSSWQTTTQSTSTTSQSGAYAGFGFGGNGIYSSSGYGGAGGGGWYGGSGSYPDGSGDDDRGGGGGSGFVWTGLNAPSGYLLGSEYYLTDASTIAGNASMPSTSGGTETGHTGNGYARITAIKVDSLNLPVNIGGTWKDANEAFVNIDGTWKTVEATFVNIGGTWKELS